MAKDEGLHSPKAIAFIPSEGSRIRIRLVAKNYSALRGSCIEKAADFLQTRKRVVNRLSVRLIKNLGDKEWIK